jgi:hypothetical protein
MAGMSGAGICGVKARGRLPSPDVPGRHFCDLGLHKGLYGKKIYRTVNLYILMQAGSSAGP